MKKILIINDDRSFNLLMSIRLERQDFTCFSALTIEDGEKLFETNPDAHAILLDGCVPGRVLNTLPLLKKFTDASFKGHIIATSSYPDYREKMCENGCTNEWEITASFEKLLEILEKEPPEFSK